MIGNVPEMNNPSNNDVYPNAFFTDSPAGAQPSIMGRTLWIPLGAWFNLSSFQAFPLVALQYNELTINVTFRPINEWFVVRDVMDYANDYPVVAPNFNNDRIKIMALCIQQLQELKQLFSCFKHRSFLSFTRVTIPLRLV
jgi:hypothetical protein